MRGTLHSELTAGTPVGCLLCAYLSGLAPSEQEDWQRELALPVTEVGNTAVVAVLAKRGVDLTEASVRRHRKAHV